MTAAGVPMGMARTEPSHRGNWTTPGWADPNAPPRWVKTSAAVCSLGARVTSGKRMLLVPPRLVPAVFPEKAGSSYHQVPVLYSVRLIAFSPTRMVLVVPSVTSLIPRGAELVPVGE